ncbi:MAG: hypothetical protein GX322_06945 [Firmicutes bacterium]|nr:hypothetical protein [Bacillota bacterium]
MTSGRISVNGRVWESQEALQWVDGVLLVPLQVVAERLGACVYWQSYPHRFKVEKGENSWEFSLDKDIVCVSSMGMDIHGPVCMHGLGKVMVPVSLLSQCLDLQWAYLADIDALIITRREPALEGRCIMLDAGHGGDDPGAAHGLLIESELNWDIAQRLADILELCGVDVRYTRKKLGEATLAQRLDIANRAQPDLFISIHHNSFPDAKMNGTEVYWYGNWSARQLAEYIQDHVLEELGTLNRGVREAAFYLLRHVSSVSVLIKVGFLTGLEDSTKVADPWLRERVALGIFRGIRDYIEVHSVQM